MYPLVFVPGQILQVPASSCSARCELAAAVATESAVTPNKGRLGKMSLQHRAGDTINLHKKRSRMNHQIL